MRKSLSTGIVTLYLTFTLPVATQANIIEETVTTAQFKGVSPYVTDISIKFANTQGVNIRSEPNIDSKILGQTLLNTSFEVVQELDGWSMITIEDGYAYIKSDYLSDTETSIEYLGKFKISHYCCERYKHICGNGTGKTAMGLNVQPGIISVDPKVIPLGSTIIINGKEYLAVDTGGKIKGNKIDLAVPTHQEAKNLGIYYADVYIKRGDSDEAN